MVTVKPSETQSTTAKLKHLTCSLNFQITGRHSALPWPSEHSNHCMNFSAWFFSTDLPAQLSAQSSPHQSSSKALQHDFLSKIYLFSLAILHLCSLMSLMARDCKWLICSTVPDALDHVIYRSWAF